MMGRSTSQIAQDILDGNGKDYLIAVLGQQGYTDIVSLSRAVIQAGEGVSKVLQFHEHGVITLDGSSKQHLVRALEALS